MASKTTRLPWDWFLFFTVGSKSVTRQLYGCVPRNRALYDKGLSQTKKNRGVNGDEEGNLHFQRISFFIRPSLYVNVTFGNE